MSKQDMMDEFLRNMVAKTIYIIYSVQGHVGFYPAKNTSICHKVILVLTSFSLCLRA